MTALLLDASAGRAQHSGKRDVLLRLADDFDKQLESRRTSLYFELLASTNPAVKALNDNPDIQLMYIGDHGQPVYFEARNLNAAKTIGTDRVWPGGDTGYDLTGSGTQAGEFAVWDVGGVLLEHQEFSGRVTQIDKPKHLHYHATAVAATLIAAGIDPRARGMSFESILDAYDTEHDIREMITAAANNLLVSNHSYGIPAGWYYNRENKKWYWYGYMRLSSQEDFMFGFYDPEVRAWDMIAYHAPNYLIVNSAGNDRADTGPKQGEGHYHWDSGKREYVWSTDHHDRDGERLGGYDTISGQSNAKNILTIGAVADIPTGYTGPEDVVQTYFSSWGPTDDGRIKPDLVANGDSLFTASSAGVAVYDTLRGTSFAAPSVAGSINLLLEQYKQIKGRIPRSATMKAIVIFAADEAGDDPGPDYSNGWGLMNTARSADAIAGAATIVEDALIAGRNRIFEFTLNTARDVRTTIVWTDPAGPVLAPAINHATPILVHDLDLRIEHMASGEIYEPWVLHRKKPSVAATRGDNTTDNVEQIDIDNAEPGRYRVVVSHKGSMRTTEQQFSIVCSADMTDYAVVSFRSGWSYDAVKVNWTMADDPDGYEFEVSRRQKAYGTPQILTCEITGEGRDLTFCDNTAQLATSYIYRVSVSRNGGEVAAFETSITTPPYPYVLRQNYPNPFATATRIDFTLPKVTPVLLRVYDVKGRLVRTLINEDLSYGPHSRPWDGADAGGNRLASGVYFYRLETNRGVLVRKMVLLR